MLKQLKSSWWRIMKLFNISSESRLSSKQQHTVRIVQHIVFLTEQCLSHVSILVSVVRFGSETRPNLAKFTIVLSRHSETVQPKTVPPNFIQQDSVTVSIV